jgi:hypothetical protein
MSVNPEGLVAIPSEERERLEEMGEARVRLVFNTNGFGSSNRIYAGKWLAELDEVQRARNEALQVEQTRVNKSTLKAAWIAAYAAIGANVVTILAWIFPLH